MAALLAVASTSRANPGRRPRRVTVCDHAFADRRESWKRLFAAQGFVDGENLALTIMKENALDPARAEHAERAAREVVASRPDVIVVVNVWFNHFIRLTDDIPVVFAGMTDPEAHGALDSLRRPGGNVTGVRDMFLERLEKRLEWLKEMRPGARRAALVGMPGPLDKTIRTRLPLIGSRLGMTTAWVKAPNAVRADVLERDLRAAKVDVADFGIFGTREVADMLIGLQVPASFATPLCVRNGGLISYNSVGMQAMAVAIAARILRGEDVRTIPTVQATSFHLAVNLRTARALGITVPESIRILANEVIE